MTVNSYTQLYCIFGSPVRHSLSPIMHNRAFLSMGMNALYMAFEPETIKSALDSMKSLGIAGASITIPFKIEAMKYMDYIDPLAESIGSVNTVFNDNGVLKGYNTDGYGALDAIKNNGIQVNGEKVLILGNGGSARSIAFTLLSSGAEVYISGRNHEKIVSLTDDLKQEYKSVDYILTESIQKNFMENINIIINTTPLGMFPDIDSIPISAELLNSEHIVFDIVYAPESTHLLNCALSKGCKIIKGLDMLVYQGARQFNIWTGASPPVDIMKRTLNEYLNKSGENDGNQ